MYNDIAKGNGHWLINHEAFGNEVFLRVSKGAADIIFMVNVLIMIDNNSCCWLVRWLRRLRAMTYFNFVAEAGAPAIAREKGKKEKNMKMRTIALTIAIFILMYALAGCGPRPKKVTAAAEARNDAVKTYVMNDNAADAFLIEKYKESELKRVDMAYKLKMAELKAALKRDLETMAKASGGVLKFTPEQAASVIEKVENKKTAILLQRDIMMRQVDTVARALYTARERNKINLAIATKLNEAIEDYEGAGVDMTAAQKSIEAIILLLQKHNVLDEKGPGVPPVVLPDAPRPPGE